MPRGKLGAIVALALFACVEELDKALVAIRAGRERLKGGKP